MKMKTAKVRRARRRFAWTQWEDEELLDLRLCDLGVTVEGSWLERPIAALYRELERRDLILKPHFWLAEEWFCPDGVPGIAIPFYLAHPRLSRLERAQMLEVEGAGHAWCMKILRHEAGHAMQNAYRLHRRRQYQQLFGRSTEPYPDYYRPLPTSKDYVQNLSLWYAQSHPAEDFAETFAVWLRPQGQWKKLYFGWPALKKLQYVDSLMQDLAGTPPTVRNKKRIEPLSSLKKTLRQHYKEKRARYSTGYPDIYDRDLKRLFVTDPGRRKSESAGAFLERNRREIREMVAKWTGGYQFTLDEVFRDMIGRCRQLRLRAVGNERALKLDFAILLTVRTMQYLYARREWHPL